MRYEYNPISFLSAVSLAIVELKISIVKDRDEVARATAIGAGPISLYLLLISRATSPSLFRDLCKSIEFFCFTGLKQDLILAPGM